MSNADAKIWISADELLQDAWRLALAVHDAGFRPELLIGLWRGGTPVAIAVQEALALLGCECAHLPLATAHYSGLDERAASVRIAELPRELLELPAGARVLLVDDVFDTGLTMEQLLAAIAAARGEPLDIRIACVWWKPSRNRSRLQPHYWIRETAQWLVFPHELRGIGRAELLRCKPGLGVLAGRLPADD